MPEGVIEDFNLAGMTTQSFADGVHEQVDHREQPCVGTYAVSGEVVDVQLGTPCVPFRITANWELTATALVFSNTLLDGEPNPVLEVWLAGKPWERVD